MDNSRKKKDGDITVSRTSDESILIIKEVTDYVLTRAADDKETNTVLMHLDRNYVFYDKTEAVDDYTTPSCLRFPCAIILMLVCNMVRSLSMSAYSSMPIFFIEKLHYSRNFALTAHHLTSSYHQMTPIMGAIVIDKWMKPFYLLSLGLVLDSMFQLIHPIACIAQFRHYIEELTWLALLGRSTFSGLYQGRPWTLLAMDQFDLPTDKRQFFLYLNINFWITNLALLISFIFMPIIRMDLPLYTNGTDGYFLFFSIPAGTCLVTTTLIILSSSCFVHKSSPKNVLGRVYKCMQNAVSNRRKLRKSATWLPREHWLDYSDCENHIIKDVKRMFLVMKTVLPLIFIQSIIIQTNSRWLLQATKMDTLLYSYHIKPEQLKIIHVFLILFLIPINMRLIYPKLAKWNKNLTLWKIFFGSQIILAGYMTSGILEIFLEVTNPPQPKTDCSQLVVVNSFNCAYAMYIPQNQECIMLHGLTFYQNNRIEVEGSVTTDVLFHKMIPHLPEDMCPTIETYPMTLVEGESALHILLGDKEESHQLVYPNSKPVTGYPTVKVVCKLKDKNFNYNIQFCVAPGRQCEIDSDLDNVKTHTDIYPGIYNIYINGQYMPIKGGITLKVGGLYLVTILEDRNSTPDSIQATIGVHTLMEPNSVHILWQIPQYVLFTIGEAFYQVPEMEFLYEESPGSVRPMVVEYHVLSKSIAHLVVALTTDTSAKQSTYYLYFSIAASIAIVIFGFLIRNFPYAANLENAIVL